MPETEIKTGLLPGRIPRPFTGVRAIIWASITMAILSALAFGAYGLNEGWFSPDWRRCHSSQPEISIVGCTAVITSGYASKPAVFLALFRRGAEYLRKGNDASAISDETKAMSLFPGSSPPFVIRGKAFLNQTKYDNAIADETEAIRLKPDYADSYITRGLAYYHSGHQQLAIADETRAIQLNPDDARPYLFRGGVYKDQGKYDLAAADETKAIELKPSSLAFIYRGIAHEHLGKHDLAIADNTEALRLAPNETIALNNRCWSRAAAGKDYALALVDCNKALKINSRDPAALDSRGVVELKMGQFRQAISDFDASLRIGKNPGSLYARGVARLRSGDKSAGDTDIVAAEAIDRNIEAKYAAYGIRP